MSTSTEELRGEWPGGIATDEHGSLKFTIDCFSKERPVWVCRLCKGALMHTKAEHDLMVQAGMR